MSLLGFLLAVLQKAMSAVGKWTFDKKEVLILGQIQKPFDLLITGWLPPYESQFRFMDYCK